MTTATATRHPATDPAGWIRRIDRIEWPAAGCWAVRPGGSVTVERATRLAARRSTATIGGGALHVAEPGRGSTLELHLATHGGALRLSADVVDADRLGNWRVVGSAEMDGIAHPLSGTVGYGGVYRMGWRPTAWLDLTLTVRPQRRRAGRLDITGQVDAFAPDALVV